MNTRVALAVCLVGASGCGDVAWEVVDAGAMSVLIDVSGDRGLPSDAPRSPDRSTDVGAPSDATTARDVGPALDAGAARDAGPALDAGAARDAGPTLDAGAARDAGVVVDVPTPMDAGRCVYEPVFRDAAGDLRNAAGQIRECWPGEPLCFCDRDNDCYPQAGYVSRCAPGAADAGVPRDVPATIDLGTPRDVPTTVDVGAVRDVGTIPSSDPLVYSGSFPAGGGPTTVTITVSGRPSRQVLVYAPSSRGPTPPMILLFHGTGDTASAVFSESRVQAVADANGIVIVAPQALDNRGSDWDHVGNTGVWWLTYPNVDPATNEDLLLTRAAIVEGRRRYNVDATRVYAFGHSNGAFFATVVASTLADRIAGYATSSGGLIRCTTREDCTATATGTSCATLSPAPSQCRCTGAEKPVPIRTDGLMPPGFFAHATDDDIVSPFYACALEARMTAVGAVSRTVLRNNGGHSLPQEFVGDAWNFLRAYHR